MNTNETPNLLELVEAFGEAVSIRDFPIFGDEATDGAPSPSVCSDETSG